MEHFAAQYGAFIVELHIKNDEFCCYNTKKQSYYYCEPENQAYPPQRALVGGVTGPHFFETISIAEFTAKSEHYLNMQRNFSEPE
jgi:hypothetical protein